MNYHSNLVLSVLHKVVISNFILLLTCVCSSCRWQEAKNIIAIADCIDQNEHRIYNDTVALKKVICVLDNPIGRLFHNNLLGKAYYYMGRNLEDSYQQIAAAAECYIEADRLQIDNPIYRGRVNSCMGYICAQNDCDSLSLIFYERATKYFKESNNNWYYAQSLLNVTTRHIKLSSFSKADSLLQEFRSCQFGDQYLARFYETRGLYFDKQLQSDSALMYFKKALSKYRTQDDKCFIYLKIVQNLLDKNELVEALPYAQHIIQHAQDPRLIVNAYYCLILDAEAIHNTELLTQYTHARADAYMLRQENINKYNEGIVLLEKYLSDPHPWRWQWFMVLSIVLVCAITTMLINYRKHAALQLQFASNKITNMSLQLEKQANELNMAYHKTHQTKMKEEIRIKYPTPPNRWNDYRRLKIDIAPYLSTWLSALEELNLTNREKVLCTFIFLYPYLSVEDLAKFMCMTKGGVQVIKTHIVKKVGITSTQLVDYLQEMSKE